jgi:hypothetical protein
VLQSKIAETLIIVLHCTMMNGERVETGWALMPALLLAEGGRSTRERRIGELLVYLPWFYLP